MGCRALLLVAVVLTAQLCRWPANAGGGHGLSVEFIHRDSPKSPFHDPSLTARARLLAAARRSTARAAALARSYAAGGTPDGAVSEVVPRPWEYLMYVNVGTPRTRMLAIVDTGSDLIWLKCANGTSGPPAAAAGAVFDPSSSSTYGRVFCDSSACHSLHGTTSCDANSNCQYQYTYDDGYNTTGLLATETFTFDDAPGGCTGCRERPQLQVANLNFGCSTAKNENGTSDDDDGLVGLGAGNMSLISQIGASTSLGRRFSYCLVPFSVNAPSFLNFGARAAVTEPGAATTPLVPSDMDYFYTVALESVGIGNKTFTLPNTPHVMLDSGTTLTYLDKGLFDPMVEELTRSIKLPRVASPVDFMPLCYDVTGITLEWVLENIVPDVKLGLGGGAVVTMKAQNMFVRAREWTICMAVVPTTEDQPVGIIGNVAQQDMHVGYDLDKRTVTFAAADCAVAYPSPPASLHVPKLVGPLLPKYLGVEYFGKLI